jgi:hypothetical protein
MQKKLAVQSQDEEINGFVQNLGAQKVLKELLPYLLELFYDLHCPYLLPP